MGGSSAGEAGAGNETLTRRECAEICRQATVRKPNTLHTAYGTAQFKLNAAIEEEKAMKAKAAEEG
eukprot:5829298-Pleurochrysis_carterae.AAC.1